jgi:flavodoxin
MKSIVIYTSQAHGNTKKVAQVIADTLKVELIETEKVNPNDLNQFDLVGFGSGIYSGDFHEEIHKLISKLPSLTAKKAFVFSTSGYGKSSLNDKTKKELVDKGFNVIGSFACKGLDTFGIMKLIGGVAKGRPNEKDLQEARIFAKGLLK